MTAWVYLSIAILLEIVGTLLLKLSDGFDKWHWGALSILCYITYFWFLAPALKVLPVGVVYAIWSGIGIAAIGVIGYFAFGEKLGAAQLAFIAMIFLGAMGLRLSTTS